MSKRTGLIGSCCLLAVVLAATQGQSQEHKQMDPEQMAMMAKMMAYATPGANHQHLGAMTGTFICETKFWMAPGAPPEQSTGTMTSRWMLDNRYLQQNYKGEWMGQPFHGFGLMGFDNSTNKFFSTWMDTFSTGLFYETGSCDESGKNFTLSGENFDPHLGTKRSTKSSIEVINDSKHILRMFSKTPDGKEMKTFEMIATKK